MSSVKKNIVSGTLWATGGQLVSLLVLLITNIWLARILSPNEFGQIGIIMFFITIAGVFSEGGLGGALVRKKNITKEDYSTVFIFNLIVSIFCFLLLVISSGTIADFYNDITLENLLIVSGLVLIFNAFQITQNAKIVSELRFKTRSVFKFISVLIGSVIGIICAYNELGVWSLIYMQLATSGSLTVLYWMYEGVFFSLRFNKSSFKELYSFGVNTTLASLLNTAFENIYQLILGRYFSVAQVGYYYQAKRLQDVPGGIINMISQSVIFSSLAKLQDDKKEFAKTYNEIVLLFLVVLGFISSFIYIYAEQIILVTYGAKWLDATFYMQLLTIASFFYLQEKINRVIFKVFNKTRQVLYLEFLKKGIQSISIIIGIIYLNINILIIGFVITSIIGYFINYYFSRKILEVDSKFELYTILKVISISFICILVTYNINIQITNTYIRLITIPLFMVLYWGGLYFLKIFNVLLFATKINNLRKKKA